MNKDKILSKFKEIKKGHKLQMGGFAAALALSMLLLPIIPQVNSPPQDTFNPGITIGQHQLVLTVGTVEAAGTADYSCDGTDDDVQFQAALNALPVGGGKLVILAGDYVFGATVSRAIDNITIQGIGRASYLANDGITALFDAGTQSNWIFRDFRTDIGSINIATATGWTMENVWLGASYYALRVDDNITATSIRAPTGRTATFTVAASDSSAADKAQADYLCDGTDDQVEIQVAIDATDAVGGGLVYLCEGTFNIHDTITIKNLVSIAGSGWNTELKLINNANCNMFESDPTANAGYLVLRDMQLGGNDNNNVSGSCIYITAGYLHGDWYYERLLINHWADNGIYIESGWQHHVLDCIIEFIYGDACFYAKPTGVTSDTNVRRLYLIGSTFYAAPDNVNPVNAIRLEGGNGKQLNERIIISSCSLGSRDANTIYLESVQDFIISNNVITAVNVVDNGIYICDDGVLASEKGMINGNLFGRKGVTNHKHGISLVGLTTGVGIGVNQYNVSEEAVVVTAPNTGGFRQSTFNIFQDVLAVSATGIRSNEDLGEAIPNTFTLDAQPDVPRTLSGHFDAHAQITAYTIVITGVDAKGNTVTETFTEAASPWDFETSNAYATVTSIIMTTRTGTGAGDTMDIGITDVLGLSNVIYETGDVYKIKKNAANAVVAGAQVNATYDTYDMSVITLAATDDFTIWYRSNLNIIS